MKKYSFLLMYLILASLIFTSCEKDDNNQQIEKLEKEVAELKALLDEENRITQVAFTGEDMILTFSNGDEIRTKAPTSIIPYIGENGNWWVNGEDLGVSAQAEIPVIGENGNWWVGGTDTGIAAQGADGVDGEPGTGIASVDYDPETAMLTLTLTDGTVYAYVLFNDEGVNGNRIDDLNGKYLLTSITNGDMPFIKLSYTSQNQLGEIAYYATVHNAPVKRLAVKRTFNTDNTVASQTMIEYATKKKAVRTGNYLPQKQRGVTLTFQEAFDELFPNGLENWNGTGEDFFNAYNGDIVKGQYVYHEYYHYSSESQTSTKGVRKYLIAQNEDSKFGISIDGDNSVIWTPRYSEWRNNWEPYDYMGHVDAYTSEDIIADNNGNVYAAQGAERVYGKHFPYSHLATSCTADNVDDVKNGTLKDYIMLNGENIDNPDNISGAYKFMFAEYQLYEPGDAIQQARFNYAYNGAETTASNEGEQVYTLNVQDDKIASVVSYNNQTPKELLQMHYTHGKLTAISSPCCEATNVVQITYDEEGNATDYIVDAQQLADEGFGRAFAALGLAYRSEVYDEELGCVVEKYNYPQEPTNLLRVNYNHGLKNFMNHTFTAINPLWTAFNAANAMEELIWQGHGSMFVASYKGFNEGGYPTSFKGLLQFSPYYDEELASSELPVNIGIATTYKLTYKKIEE
ncbi:MAG: hypothetical protein R6U66_02105 [Bacteroidales bacterium]